MIVIVIIELLYVILRMLGGGETGVCINTGWRFAVENMHQFLPLSYFLASSGEPGDGTARPG